MIRKFEKLVCVKIAHVLGIPNFKKKKYLSSFPEPLNTETDTPKDQSTVQDMMFMHFKIMMTEKKVRKIEEIKWQFAARVLNRLFFYVSVALCVVVYSSFLLVIITIE